MANAAHFRKELFVAKTGHVILPGDKVLVIACNKHTYWYEAVYEGYYTYQREKRDYQRNDAGEWYFTTYTEEYVRCRVRRVDDNYRSLLNDNLIFPIYEKEWPDE